MVILLHREDVYEKESTRAGEADLIVAKHRNGPTATSSSPSRATTPASSTWPRAEPGGSAAAAHDQNVAVAAVPHALRGELRAVEGDEQERAVVERHELGVRDALPVRRVEPAEAAHPEVHHRVVPSPASASTVTWLSHSANANRKAPGRATRRRRTTRVRPPVRTSIATRPEAGS